MDHSAKNGSVESYQLQVASRPTIAQPCGCQRRPQCFKNWADRPGLFLIYGAGQPVQIPWAPIDSSIFKAGQAGRVFPGVEYQGGATSLIQMLIQPVDVGDDLPLLVCHGASPGFGLPGLGMLMLGYQHLRWVACRRSGWGGLPQPPGHRDFKMEHWSWQSQPVRVYQDRRRASGAIAASRWRAPDQS